MGRRLGSAAAPVIDGTVREAGGFESSGDTVVR